MRSWNSKMFQDTEEIRSLRPIKYFRLTGESKIKRLTNRQMKSGQAASVLTGFRIPYHSVSYMKLCNRFFFFYFTLFWFYFYLLRKNSWGAGVLPLFAPDLLQELHRPPHPKTFKCEFTKSFIQIILHAKIVLFL